MFNLWLCITGSSVPLRSIFNENKLNYFFSNVSTVSIKAVVLKLWWAVASFQRLSNTRAPGFNIVPKDQVKNEKKSLSL